MLLNFINHDCDVTQIPGHHFMAQMLCELQYLTLSHDIMTNLQQTTLKTSLDRNNENLQLIINCKIT